MYNNNGSNSERGKLDNNRPSWTSKYAFIITTIGSAVGLGNIWRFPYIMVQNGGAIFLTVYIILICTICFVPLINELYIGKLTKKECVGAYESIHPNLKYVGSLNPITGILISAFYFILCGCIIHYIINCLTSCNLDNYDDYFFLFI